MKSTISALLPRLVLALILGAGLVGCGNDDDGTTGTGGGGGDAETDLVGTWVAYDALWNGQSTSAGTSGEVMIVEDDGTGSMADISDPTNEFYFDWSVAGNVITAVSEEFGVQIATFVLSGDMLSITVVEGGGNFTTIYERHRGEKELHGTWEFVSAVDEYSEDDLEARPHSLEFGADGNYTVLYVGGDPLSGTYSADGPRLTLNPGGQVAEMVFTVTGRTLYLFRFEMTYEQEGPVPSLICVRYRAS